MKPKSSIQPLGLLTIQQAAEYTGIKAQTLYKWVSERKVPHIKLGRLLRFDHRLLDEWLARKTVMPMPPRPLDK